MPPTAAREAGAKKSSSSTVAGDDSSLSNAATKRPRQNPGPACQQCRVKKLRCDRKKPCGWCTDAGVQCHVDKTPPQRGPKRGYLKVLRSRIAALEARLGSQDGTGPAGPDGADHSLDLDLDLDEGDLEADSPCPSPASDPRADSPLTADVCRFPNDDMFWPHLPTDLPVMVSPPPPWSQPIDHVAAMDVNQHSMGNVSISAQPALPPLEVQMPSISPLMRTDLDQLYFDRVHAFVPMLQKARYMRRAARCRSQRQPTAAAATAFYSTSSSSSSSSLSSPSSSSQSHSCLQLAMWTMAAALSSQFHQLRSTLYLNTLERLKALELAPPPPPPRRANTAAAGDQEDEDVGAAGRLEQAQAWILIAVYEFMQAGGFQRAWASAGRAIRLVQLMRLHELDDHPQRRQQQQQHQSRRLSRQGLSHQSHFNSSDSEPDAVALEEKRRTFWVAFCLDRFSCVVDGLPLTLGELKILTRLPCPEDVFQSNAVLNTPMPFLAQVTNLADGDCTSTGSNSTLPSLGQSIVFTALWGHVVAHLQESMRYGGHQEQHDPPDGEPDTSLLATPPLSRASSSAPTTTAAADLWARQVLLDQALTRRMLHLYRSHKPEAIHADPMLHFTSMIAHVSLLSLCNAADCLAAPPSGAGSTTSGGGDDAPAAEYKEMAASYRVRGPAAAREMVRLSQDLAHFGSFKTHLFAPIPLGVCREYLLELKGCDSSADQDIRTIEEALRELKEVNAMGQETPVATLGTVDWDDATAAVLSADCLIC